MNKQSWQIQIKGLVQGLGFRPFIYRLAKELNLNGWVNNSAEGVIIQINSNKEALSQFIELIQSKKPELSIINTLTIKQISKKQFNDFSVIKSQLSKDKTALVLPDLATCKDCLKEILDPNDRRYRYPFTNCTNCGPRFSIIEAIPYDRHLTSMKTFKMCPACQSEYDDPTDRRFHAQPNACPECGPKVELWDKKGHVLAEHDQAITSCAQLIQQGKIVAVKGIGGFHLMCNAQDESALLTLRKRKSRKSKPFAVLFSNLEQIKHYCFVNDFEEKELTSIRAPIVLLKQKQSLAPPVSPHNSWIGAFLPFSPLHWILTQELNSPVVATSGNQSEEPICTDEHEALDALNEIADFFLVHNRPILRHVDDSIVKIINNHPVLFRRSRGYAPLPVAVNFKQQETLAVGSHLKNTFSFLRNDFVYMSQHLGDLETKKSIFAFNQEIKNFQNFFDLKPKTIHCDLHPDYYSSQYAQQLSRPVFPIQHHEAHVFSCMNDNKINGPLLAIAWDGTGLGHDNTIWGGEFFSVTDQNKISRVGSLRPFCLPGGDLATKEPWRILASLLSNLNLPQSLISSLESLKAFQTKIPFLYEMIEKKIHSPFCSSIGRLFDAMACLLNLHTHIDFEGQASIALEQLAEKSSNKLNPYSIKLDQSKSGLKLWDWRLTFEEALCDLSNKVPSDEIAMKFHLTCAELIFKMSSSYKQNRICLSGGCFQNAILVENTIALCQKNNIEVFIHKQVPPNDGGLSLGQLNTRK